MLIIGIAGAHSGSGKTRVAEMLLKELTAGGISHFKSLKKWSAIKYTKTELYWSVSDCEDDIKVGNKDTSRLSSAGAERVVWIKSPPESLDEAVPIAMNLIGDVDGLIVEGNSLVEFLSPAIVVFVSPTDVALIKPSSERLLSKADIVVQQLNGISMSDTNADYVIYTLKGDERLDQKELMILMEDVFIKKEIKKRFVEKSKDGRISCKEARKIAEDISVPYRVVGEMANDLKIKIFACELGCF